MPEAIVVPAGPAAAQTTAEGGSADAQTGGVNQTPETKAIIQEALREAFGGKSPEEFRNSLFAAARRGTPAGEPAPKKTEAETTIDARVRSLEDEKRQVEADRRENSLLAALTSAGVPAERQDAALDHLERRFGSKIKYNRETRQVEYSEFEGDAPKPVSAFVSEFLKQPKGQIFLPAPAMAGVPRGRAAHPQNAKAYHELPQSERDKLSPEERAAWVRRDLGR